MVFGLLTAEFANCARTYSNKLSTTYAMANAVLNSQAMCPTCVPTPGFTKLPRADPTDAARRIMLQRRT